MGYLTRLFHQPTSTASPTQFGETLGLHPKLQAVNDIPVNTIPSWGNSVRQPLAVMQVTHDHVAGASGLAVSPRTFSAHHRRLKCCR